MSARTDTGKTRGKAPGKKTTRRARPSEVELGILRGLREAVAFRRGKLPGVEVRDRIVTARQAKAETAPEYSPARIKVLRGRLKLSQAVFAQALNVSPETLRCWEQGKRHPDGTAMRLLQITEEHPEWVLSRVSARPDARRPVVSR